MASYRAYGVTCDHPGCEDSIPYLNEPADAELFGWYVPFAWDLCDPITSITRAYCPRHAPKDNS